MTRNEATLLMLIVLAAGFTVFAICGVELHHFAHQLGQELQPGRFGQ